MKHAACLYLSNSPSHHLSLKLDFCNVFNCLRWDRMLSAAKGLVQELYSFVVSAYGIPSHLFCGEQSTEGVQQATQLSAMGERPNLLQTHDDLLLLRHPFSIPKLLYLLHTSPCFLGEHLEVFDDTLHHLLCKIINVSLDDDSVWL